MAWVLVPLHGQDFERVAPKPVPAQGAAAALPDALPPPAQGDAAILVDKLLGLAFLTSATEIRNPPPSVRGMDTGGIELLQRPAFARVAEPFLGRPVSLQSINELVRAVILYCREQDHPVVDVIVPEQEIGSGVLQLVLVESKAGEVRAEGARWFSKQALARKVRTGRGASILASSVLADVDWINTNPFRRADVVFTPGAEPATTDIVLKVEDRFPVRFYAGYEDSGNDLTGDERFLAGFNWGNVLGLDHQFNYQFTTSSDFFDGSADLEGLRAHSYSYLVPLPWRHTFTVFASHAESEAASLPFNLEGSSVQIGARYNAPLPPIGKHYRHEAYAGFDWKQSDNTLEFGFIPAGASLTDVAQWVFGYRSSISDPWGGWNFGPELVWSPGETFGHQSDADLQASRPGATSQYVYVKMDIGRTTRLPWDFTLSNQLSWQVADNNLLGSEQMSVGGYSSVRGYDERELNNTDEGWILRNELRTPPLSVLRLFGVEGVNDQLQFLGFFDYASVRSDSGSLGRDDGRAVGSETLASAGPGLRYILGPWASVRADYGFQLNDAGNTRHNGRWHVGVLLSY